jgi:hypothetical protein
MAPQREAPDISCAQLFAGRHRPERFLPCLRLVMDEYQPGHLRRVDGDSEKRGE